MTPRFSGDTPDRPGIRPGQPWGTEAFAPPDLEVTGGDGALASVMRRGVPEPLVRFIAAPDSDLARAVGLVPGAALTGMALPLDALELVVGSGSPGLLADSAATGGGEGPYRAHGATGRALAVNSVIVGVAPDRLRAWHRPAGLAVEIDGAPVAAAPATTLVVMNGQYLRGLDVSPRGHPGDGVAEAQLYALPPAARRAMRNRLATGAHVPHPGITVRRAHRVVVRASRPAPLELDGAPAGRITALEITLRPAAYRLLI